MKKKISKTKSNLIKKIKAIIKKHGSFGTGEVQADCSPCIGTLGSRTCQLAESFDINKVEAVTYVNDNEESTDYIEYKYLATDVLKHIYELAKDYKKQEEE